MNPQSPKPYANHPTKASDEHTFHEHAMKKLPSRRSERRPDRRFAHSPWNARKQHIRKIDAHDEQNSRHGRHQQEQAAPCRAHNFGLEWQDRGLQAHSWILCLLRNLPLHYIQFRQRLLGTDAVLQPPDSGKIELTDEVPLVFVLPIERLEEI